MDERIELSLLGFFGLALALAMLWLYVEVVKVLVTI